MSTTYGAREVGQTAGSTSRVFGLFKKSWGVLQERRERENLRAALDHLSDRELIDIGVTPGEIDYVASKRSIDPRGVYWAEHAGK
jgi:uncharacterized protein YjiS (DUF1127 family)